MKPLDLYFSGNNAVAYGTTTAGGSKITYNLKGLFGITDWANVSFTETKPKTYKDADGIEWSANAWLVDATSGDIQVDKVKSADKVNKVGNFGGAYEARALKATFVPYGNKNFAAVPYDFNLTIKSAVYEGVLEYVKPNEVKDKNGNVTGYTYTAGVAQSISVVSADPKATLTWREIKGIDKTGVTYFANEGGTAKINTVSVALEGENAKLYLEEPTGDWTNGYTVKVKANVTAPADGKTVECLVRVNVLDEWGMTKTVDVPVTLK